ncbi:hypothetical protein TWF694_001925 [Orbilia ellipsospora]|uniref:Uncharacterized protein n=1 Tax=Orbilia ellipsospora TaxID=2528407 RepID=A0AAV9X6X9_9PEZI
MKSLKTLLFSTLPVLFARTASACAADNCLRAVIASAFTTRHGTADCSSYFLATVTPPTVTITASATITTGTTVIQYVSETDTAHATDTINSHVTLTVNAASTSTTLFPPGDRKKNKRQVTVNPTSIPAYASPCSGAARYSSACSCIGVSHVTVTVPAPSTTITQTTTSTTTVTSTLTTTTITSTVTDQTVTVTTTDSTQTNAQVVVVTATTFLMQSLDYNAGDYLVPSNGGFGLAASSASAAKFQILASNGLMNLTDGSALYGTPSEVASGSDTVYFISGSPSSTVPCAPYCNIAAATNQVTCLMTCNDSSGNSHAYNMWGIYATYLVTYVDGSTVNAAMQPITFKAVAYS